jgi:hypothetical protein
MRRVCKWSSGILFAAASLIAIGAVFTFPALAAAACPACFGLERLSPNLIVEWSMTADVRNQLNADVRTANDNVRRFFGSFEQQSVVVACVSAGCYRRLGGRGAKAVTYSTPVGAVVRVSPAGLNTTILTHEFAHVHTHRIIGFWALLSGTVPAWFDEGVAVIASQDERYLWTGDRCKRTQAVQLPSRSRDWARTAGKAPEIYGAAACEVSLWLAENGGVAGLRLALQAVGQGERALPGVVDPPKQREDKNR